VIRNNPELTTLRGLEGVKQADQVLIANNGIYDIHGLSSLRQVRELAVVDNPKLHNLAGLDQLRYAGTVRLQDNPVLCARLGLLPALTYVDRLVVRSNRGLSPSEVDALFERVSQTGPRQTALR
jgi:hypothetical protein